jgi:hypothetical protein
MGLHGTGYLAFALPVGEDTVNARDATPKDQRPAVPKNLPSLNRLGLTCHLSKSRRYGAPRFTTAPLDHVITVSTSNAILCVRLTATFLTSSQHAINHQKLAKV